MSYVELKKPRRKPKGRWIPREMLKGPMNILALERRGPGKKTLVTISTGRSDFYDPIEAIRINIENHIEREANVSAPRDVDPSKVDATDPKKINQQVGHFASFKGAMDRMRRVRKERWISCTYVPKYTWAFEFEDKVIVQRFVPFVGWETFSLPRPERG